MNSMNQWREPIIIARLLRGKLWASVEEAKKNGASRIGDRSLPVLPTDSAGDSAQITALCYRLYPFPMDSNLRVITERQ